MGHCERDMTTQLATVPRHNIALRFRHFADEWKHESHFLSNTAHMVMLRSYQNIIGMGEPAIPYILEELRREPDHWFWALETITLANPVTDAEAGNVERMANAWIEWGIADRLT